MNVKDMGRALFPVNTRYRPDAVLLLAQRRRRCANIKPTLGQCLVFAGLIMGLIQIVTLYE